MEHTIELNIKLNGRSKKELSKLLSILQENVEKIEEEIKEISTAGNLIVIVTSEKDYFIPISLK